MSSDQRDRVTQEIFAGSRLSVSRDPMTPAGARHRRTVSRLGRSPRCRSGIGAAALVTALAMLTLVVVAARVHEAGPGPMIAPAQGSVEQPMATPPIAPETLASLPTATTNSTVPAATRDHAHGAPSGRLVHPATTVPGYRTPGGPAIVAVPPQQIAGSDTWLPVIAEQPGWVEVLLPVRPNGAAAWLRLDEHLDLAHSPYLIRVDRAHFTVTLHREGVEVARWTVGIGQMGSPTPVGRAFVLAAIVEEHPTYSPITLPTSFHSDTYESYGGGPGTVGIHGWPDPAVFGTASSAGCVRVPDDALHRLATEVPIGTPILIT